MGDDSYDKNTRCLHYTGPILRRYQLRSITVETMGSSYSIPALEEKVAYELRDNIAEYAKIKEVEQT